VDTVALLADALVLAPAPRATLIAAARPDSALSAGMRTLAAGLDAASSLLPPDAPRHNLPHPLSSFIGREREVGELMRILRGTRLLTLTGTGGVGKTRLALQVARALVSTFEGGVWLVELEALTNGNLLPGAIADAVGLRDRLGPEPASLAKALQDKRLLLLLDNCEHLLDACASMADGLLRGCPHLRVLATSREALGLTGEVAWRVPSLPAPEASAGPTLAALSRNDAVRLFLARAVAVQSRFSLTERNAAAVAQLCRRLDGIPLALELAAARMDALSAGQLAARLGQRFRLLTGGSRTAFPRQRTLRATVDWSYGLLSDRERALFDRLAVFTGGWSLDAAEAVCSGDGLAREEVVDLLTLLVRKSLVLAEETSDGAERYRLLETLRQYALESLRQRGEAAAVRGRHAAYYLTLAEAVSPDRAGRPDLAWGMPTLRGALAGLAAEQGNLRAALSWWVEAGDIPRSGRLVDALWPIWFYRGHLGEARAWLDHLLALPAVYDAPDVRERGLLGLANIARRQGDLATALTALAEILRWKRLAGANLGVVKTLIELANVHYQRADFAAAHACLDESKAIAGAGDAGLALDWAFIGGEVALHEGNHIAARSLLEEALAFARAQDKRQVSAYCLVNLGHLARERGDIEQAPRLLRQGLEIAREFGDRPLIAHALEGIACGEVAAGRPRRALLLSAAASGLRATCGAPLSPAWRRMLEPWLQAARRAVADDAAASATAAGQAMPLETAIAQGLGRAGRR
jgi:predicted ATPase